MTTRRTISDEQKLEWGRRVHEGEWPRRDQAAVALGISTSQIFLYLKMYRESIGLEEAGRGAATIAAKRLKDAERHREKRAEMKAKANGGSHPAPALLAEQVAPLAQVARIRELEAQLAAAMDEVHTLQKILMTVGRSL